MMKTRWAVAALIIAGLASPTIGASAKTYKHSSKQTSMTKPSNAKSGVTTGANMKKSNAPENSSTGTSSSPGATTKKGY